MADFKANVRVGVDGALKEQPFEAARLALSDRIADGANAGFLRDGARLALVFVSDEDDCSDTEAPFAIDDIDCRNERHSRTGASIRSLTWSSSSARRSRASCATWSSPRSWASTRRRGDLLRPCANTACSTALDGGAGSPALAERLGTMRTRTGSICDASFRRNLEDIAGLLVAQSLPLEGAPATTGCSSSGSIATGVATIPCTVALDGSTEAVSAGAVYSPPLAGRQATITFQNACRLQQGDRVQLHVACAG